MIEKGFYIKTLKKSFEQKRKWFVFVINWTVNPLFFFTVVFSYNILDFCSWHPLKILYWKTARCKCFYCLTLEWAFKKQNSLKFFYKCLEWRVKKKNKTLSLFPITKDIENGYQHVQEIDFWMQKAKVNFTINTNFFLNTNCVYISSDWF